MASLEWLPNPFTALYTLSAGKSATQGYRDAATRRGIDVTSPSYAAGQVNATLATLGVGAEAAAKSAPKAIKGLASLRKGGATKNAPPPIKPGSAGGPSSGKPFSQRVRQEELANNPSTCVYCRMETDRPQVDHVIPRSRGGNATIGNAQTTCPHCNASKGAIDFPVTPPAGYSGPWPPPWWGIP